MLLTQRIQETNHIPAKIHGTGKNSSTCALNILFDKIIKTMVSTELKYEIHPARLTWNLRINPWKRRNIFQTIIFRFYVNLGGCISLKSHKVGPYQWSYRARINCFAHLGGCTSSHVFAPMPIWKSFGHLLLEGKY